MGMTMTQKILAAHCGEASVTAGQLINAKLDIVLGNDITTPVAINEFEKAGFNSVFDKTRVNIVLDHFVPNKDIKSATQSKQCREFANKYDILNFYDVGQMGIEHALLPEKGIVTAGDCVIGADSHTCTYGALGAFSTGVGSTDMAAGMATGMAWFKVPAAIKVELKGAIHAPVCGKDVILHLIGEIGVSGALYKSLEFVGEGMNEKGIDKATGKVVIEVSPDFYRPTDVVNLWGDPSKAKRELGWNPTKTTFEQLVKIMVDHDMKKVAVERAEEHIKTNLAEYLEKGVIK